MLALVLHGLRARRAQSLTIFVLSLLAGLGSAVGPWFLAWGSDAVARANIAAAPLPERLIIASGELRLRPGSPSPVQLMRDLVAEHLAVPGAPTHVAAALRATIEPASPVDRSQSVSVNLGYRDDVCDHVDLVAGTCPDGGDEVLVSRLVAQRSGLDVGDPVVVGSARMSSDATLRVSGVYEVSDPDSSYWAGSEVLPAPGGTSTVEPAFVSERALLGLSLQSVDLEATLVLPENGLMDPDFDLGARLNQATAAMALERIDVLSSVPILLQRIYEDQLLVVLGVGVAAAQLVLVCWVGLFLAVRHTAQDRRADVGLLKLRGATGRRVWMLITLLVGLPMLAGTLSGAGIAFLTAGGLAASIGGGAGAGLLDVAHSSRLSTVDTIGLSLAATAVAALGLVAAVVAEWWRTARTPVVDLVRRVPARQRGWRADVTELVLVIIAGAGVYQARVEAGGGAVASALALLAPALVGVAVSLVVARTLLLVAGGVGARSLRAGRAGTALAALQLARRRGPHRVFAVVAVATVIFVSAVSAWHSASVAWRQRAALELGAARVLSVDAPSAAALLAAVRAVDPEGRYAMAAAGNVGRRSDDRVLAVDAARLARVGAFPDGGPSPGQIGTLLRPPAPDPPQVADGPVTLDAALTGTAAGPALGVRLNLSTADGSPIQVDFPPLASERGRVTAAVQGCPEGCRLVSLQITGPAEVTLPEAVTVEIHELSQNGGAVLSPAMLGDVARWRTVLAFPAVPPEISPQDGRLAITMAAGSDLESVDARVFPLDVPVPLPVVVAGAPPPTLGAELRIAVLGGQPVPFRVAASVPMLPQVADRGMFVDLEYALRSNDTPSQPADLFVWLTEDAPASLLAALADHGVNVGSQSSIAARTADLAATGPGVALTYASFVAVVVLLLGAGVTFGGSTVEHAGRVDELVALRGQGLPVRAVRGAGLASAVVLVGAATATGALAALLARMVVPIDLPVFSDGWAVLPVPSGLTPVTLAVAVGVVVVVIGAAALWGAGRLVAAVSARLRRGSVAP